MAIDLTRGPTSVRNIKEESSRSTDAKPSRVEKIRAALNEVETSGTFQDCITKTPGAFLWEFYKAWVENGGQDGGKNRNSIRRMRDHWLTGDAEVKSLHPKLTGRIRISKDDAKNLMTLFLGRWKFVAVKEGDWVLTADGYAPFPCRDCKKLCERLADAMYPAGSEQARVGLGLPVRLGGPNLEEIQSDWKAIDELYRTSDAVINFSRHRAALGETPAETMKFFWKLFKNFYETMEERNQIFIWIIDIGSRQAEDEDAWAEFFNFEMLKAQFRAFATFDSDEDSEESETNSADSSTKVEQRSAIREAFLRSLTIPEETHREKRWKWLCDHTVIVIQNLRKEEFSHLYEAEDAGIDKIRLKDTGVTAENILPKMLPHSWAQDRTLRDLYGSQLENVADATLTAFYRQDGWNSAERPAVHRNVVDIRYFAHALTRRQTNTALSDFASYATSQEIVSPGDVYDEAFRIVYWAARHRLQSFGGEDDQNRDWSIAVAYLNNQGFRTLKLLDFLAIHRAPFG